MARKQLKLAGTGANEALSGMEMTVEPVALYNQEHLIIGYMPMIKALNQYGNMTMVCPGLAELANYHNGELTADWFESVGLNTPEGAMAVYEAARPLYGDQMLIQANEYGQREYIRAGGFMRTLAPAVNVSQDEQTGGTEVEYDLEGVEY